MSLKTNNYLIGIGYSGLMSAEIVACGRKFIKENCVVKILIHPIAFGAENQIAKNGILKDKIVKRNGIENFVLYRFIKTRCFFCCIILSVIFNKTDI
jgi:hypothetical protein